MSKSRADPTTVATGYCGRKFAKINDLQHHEEDFHTKMKCNTCEYNSFRKKELEYHTKIIHTQLANQMQYM